MMDGWDQDEVEYWCVTAGIKCLQAFKYALYLSLLAQMMTSAKRFLHCFLTETLAVTLALFLLVFGLLTLECNSHLDLADTKQSVALQITLFLELTGLALYAFLILADYSMERPKNAIFSFLLTFGVCLVAAEFMEEYLNKEDTAAKSKII